MTLEDAQAALNLSRNKLASNDLAGALKWCRKSISIHSTSDARALLEKLENRGLDAEPGASAASTPPNGSATPATDKGKGRAMNGSASAPEGLRARASAASSGTATPSEEPKKRDFTPAQEAVVKKVNKAGKENDFYGVLGLKKDDKPDETAIKKGYRKLALQLHPDKNGAPGADEAFKIVSKAFTILSDPDKKAMYDRTGADPDSRGGGGGGGGFHPSQFRGAQQFRTYGGGFGGAQEIDPQDLFNMFFGGGMGNGFGGGTTFHFGGPGMRTQYRAGGPNVRRAQADQGGSVLLQLLPIIILGLFSLLSYAPNLFMTPDPSFTWAPSGVHRAQRFTPKKGVNYYVDAKGWDTHPFVKEAEAGQKRNLNAFEDRVENSWKQVLYNTCERHREHQHRRIMSTRGFMGIGSDPELEKRIRAEKYESCERLQDWGIYM